MTVAEGDRPPLATLVLTADPAAPPVSGADLRNFQNAVAAAELGPVVLASVRPVTGGAWHNGVEAVGLSQDGDPRGKSIASRRARIEIRIPQLAADRLFALLKAFRPDAVIVEGVPLLPLMRLLRPVTRLLVLDMHNVESDLARQAGATEARWSLARWLGGSEADRIAALEREALGLADRVFVCSEIDRDRLASLHRPAIPVHVVPNGVPRFEAIPAELPPLAPRIGTWPVLLFVGHLGYAPNIEAAQRLVRHILPSVRHSVAGARLVLAGRAPVDAVRALAREPGVTLVENPADLSDLYRQSHICVVPLSAGGGTRIKILEAMAWGLPVVATPLAAEGQGLVAGQDVLLADDDRGLARHIVALCKHPHRAEHQRLCARATVEANFSPHAVAAALKSGLLTP
jgi:glycosyltransferase involved in cell wall biosynthesis